MFVLVVLAFVVGTVAISKNDRRANAAAVLAAGIGLAYAYRYAGVSLGAYQAEQLSIWAAWTTGSLVSDVPIAELKTIPVVAWPVFATVGWTVLRHRGETDSDSAQVRKRGTPFGPVCDFALGIWALFLPLMMTLGSLGEGHYGRAMGNGLLCTIVMTAFAILLYSKASAMRSTLVAFAGAFPGSLAVMFLVDSETVAVYSVWTIVAIAAGIGLKRLAER